MSEFPVQVSKIQPPPLRDQTLARDRLLDWLGAKIHDRVVLVIAEAGYGKTTLLADFSRRTRLRALWYRLDRGDRDWVGFIAHLAAAVRVHVPDFGPATDTLLRETATAAPPLDTVLDTFLRELASLPLDPSVLVFDDFHLVDDTPEIRHAVKELLARAPERLTFVFASRRVPPVPLARLRALGEVAEIGTDELRFDPAETDRLFRETYEISLDPSLISELSRRTEGWAASLQLVRAALHDRDAVQARAFIGSLSGAEGHLYDYLAEEVIGDLPAPLQDFLMRTSILETIDLELGPIAADVTVSTAKTFIEEAEHLGLYSRRGRPGPRQVRSHPLVREFLQARLSRAIDRAGVLDVHRRVASAAERLDWRVAAHHYLAAGDDANARRVLSDSIETILSTGAYASAQSLVRLLHDGELTGSAGLILASRMAILEADPESGLDLAERAWAANPDSMAAALNLITARTFAGDLDGAVALGQSLEQSSESRFASLGRGFRLLLEASLHGSVTLAFDALEGVSRVLVEGSDDHFLGIARLGQAFLRHSQGDRSGALRLADEAIGRLSSTSAGVELVSARFARAIALAHLGDLSSARHEYRIGQTVAANRQRLEAAFESAAIETLFGDENIAERILQDVDSEIAATSENGVQALFARALLSLRRGDTESADADLSQVRPNVLRSIVAFEAQRRLAVATLSLARADAAAIAEAQAAEALAAAQGARLWERQASLLKALADRSHSPDEVIVRTASVDSSALSIAAESVLRRIGELESEATEAVAGEARRRPERWRASVRRQLAMPPSKNGLAAGLLLEEIGELGDIQRLRTASRSFRSLSSVSLGRNLARRLAARVLVEDLGRVRIVIGDRIVDGSEVRRKVLGLLCLLVSKPRFSSTREEVLESLWPELDPTSALNSLNQTVYFLRRVFEPSYREEVSPGYLKQDGETIWLDLELVDARSRRCRDLVHRIPSDPNPVAASELSDEYRGKFALDFAYEEWASTYRDTLHASYLRVIEQAIRLDISAGQFARATALAERAAEVEPDSEDIQVALIRLYRLSGAHAAAAERYGHYAHGLKELGIEAPPFDEVLGDRGSISRPAY